MIVEGGKRYDLIIRFKSDRNFFEIRNEIINKRLEDKLFDDLESWEFDRCENSILSKLQNEVVEKDSQIKYQADTIKAQHEAMNKMSQEIYKMRNCCNCNNYPKPYTNKMCKYGDVCDKNLDKWEMKVGGLYDGSRSKEG